ncbi:MAG: glycoside hydrolase family 15 protein [Kofleriaceae bacterium]
MPYQPIESYGIIGDLYTVALVAPNGSIDMMSFPEFDSPTIFAAMLDDAKGGRFQISANLESSRAKQMYLPDTNILITRHLSQAGVSEIIDFMPVEAIGQQAHNLVRIVKTIRGAVTYQMVCAPRFDYARAGHTVDVRPNEIVFRSTGTDKTALRLRSSVAMTAVNGDAVASFTLHVGETAVFVLEDARTGDAPAVDLVAFCQAEFAATSGFWRQWIGKSAYRGRWNEMISRSALTLKLLTSHRHGSIVAAPTFGLPEHIGGVRNWDYRYTWIRDSSFALYALLRLGFTDEARAFMHWLIARCGELNADDSLQIMYGIDGRHDLAETTLPHLEGYRGSSPVRIGNGAAGQIQLDIYGELMDAVYLYDKYVEPVSYELWHHLSRLVEWVRRHWREKDEGIWEVRGGQQEFLYSRLLCWVAIDRAIRLAHKRSLPADLAGWMTTRNEIYNEIHTVFWSPERAAFIQHRGSQSLDAACLLMPLVRFTGPTDPRWLSTLRAVETDLVDDSLVYRYRIGNSASDGLTGGEGTFTMCSFWYVECLARAGRLDDARLAFEKMLGYANHLGLYAEELGPSSEHLGNFPQAFTHLGLISAAFQLDRALSTAGWRA